MNKIIRQKKVRVCIYHVSMINCYADAYDRVNVYVETIQNYYDITRYFKYVLCIVIRF